MDVATTLMIDKLNAECGMRVGTARCPREHQHAREMPIRDDPARGNYK